MNVQISVLNGALWDMEQEHCGISISIQFGNFFEMTHYVVVNTISRINQL